MYFVALFATAFLLISIFSTNWPVKFYHHWLLKKLARELNTEPQKYGLLSSNVYSEIRCAYRGKNFRIRFIESSIDSIKTSSGVEIRMDENTGLVMEFYRAKRNKRVWGDYQQFKTGDSRIDAEWFILTTDLDQANDLWNRTSFSTLLKDIPQIEQVLINRQEIIVQLGRYHSTKATVSLLERLASLIN